MDWRRPGEKPLSEPMVVNLPTHICVARPQWVKMAKMKMIWSFIQYLTGLSIETSKYNDNLILIGGFERINWCSRYPLRILHFLNKSYQIKPFLSRDRATTLTSAECLLIGPRVHSNYACLKMYSYLPSSLQYKTHFKRQLNCWSLRCSWSSACWCCSNYIFILNLTPGFNRLGKDNYKYDEKHLSFEIRCVLY